MAAQDAGPSAPGRTKRPGVILSESSHHFNMRYWWVNQNQTFRHELAGGYLWSPKRNANGPRDPFYESMRELSPGDIIFSFVDARMAAIGIAASYCWESAKPAESVKLSVRVPTAGNANGA